MKRLTLLLGCLMLSWIALPQWVAPDRTMANSAEINPLLPEPIKVTPLTRTTDEKRKGRNLSERNRWVNEPVVQVENISGKAIKFLTLEISFPSAESSELRFLLNYGQAPGQKLSSKVADVLEPLAKVNLSLGQNACDRARLGLLVSGTQPTAASMVNSRIMGVIFADGTAWFDGLLHLPDRNNPLRWNVVGETPGRAAFDAVPHFKMMKTNLSASSVPSRPWECYTRTGTEYITCCGGAVVASGLFVEDPGGILQPRLVTYCGPEDPCEVLVSQQCGLP